MNLRSAPPSWVMGIPLGLGLAALPLSLEGVLACAVIAGYALEMGLRVHRLPLLVSGNPHA